MANTFPERMQEIIDQQKSARDFAIKCSISDSLIRAYLSGKSQPGLDNLAKIADVAQVNVQWLVTGEGPMMRGEPLIPSNLDPQGGLDLDEFDYIPMTHAELSAGDGRVVLEEGFKNRFAFRRDWLRRVGLNKNHAVMMVVRGDSMLPTLQDHDTVIVDLNRTRIDTGNIYAVNMGDDLLSIKRLEARGPQVRVISDNKAYEPYDMENQDIRVIGQVVWFSRQLVWNNME
ncbi:putative phage repressor [Desulfatibacillum aliphaticivorans]|uniref:Phage repressor n=1 Tax=Desulfatibacillum aliphaticivorans TaxID=218208 RepID=B8FGP0_DESAL|nr:S24 family peptidase [Desulfatibacillum aliphaticivorans]ACL05270.1 putative phage repressor [Desulfatibacillum aliphaticivorans]